MNDDLVRLARNDNMSREEFFELADKLCDDMADRIEALEAERDALRANLEKAKTCLRVIASGPDHNIDGQFARATLAELKEGEKQ